MIPQSKWKVEWDSELRLLPQVESVTNADLQVSENLFMLCHFLKLYQSANPQVKNVLDFLVSRNLQPLNWGSYFDEVMTRGMTKAKQLFNIMLSQSRKVHMRYAKKRPNLYLQFYPMRKYIILERINTGSVGQVHLAVEEATGEYFAAKAIDKSITQGDLGLFRKMKEEIKISCGMNHPNVVKTIGVIESAEKVIQIMEYCDGGDLISYVRNKLYLNESSAQYFFKKIVEGLKYMHTNNIAHRDLKPENIFLCKKNLSKKERTLIRIGKLPACTEYELKIGDFGASCIIENNNMLYDIVGTLSYAAPEVLGCTSTNGYDGKKADVWSLGIILYAMFFGLLPFENEDKGVKDAYREIMKTQISFPKNRVNKFSNVAKNLLCGMLNVNPEKRMSLQDVLNHRWLSDHPQSRMEISYLHKKINVPFSSTVAYPIYSANFLQAPPLVNHNGNENVQNHINTNTNTNIHIINNNNNTNNIHTNINNSNVNNNNINDVGIVHRNVVHNPVRGNQSTVYQTDESNINPKYNNYVIYKNLLVDLHNPKAVYKKETEEIKGKENTGPTQNHNSYMQEQYQISEPTNEYRNCEAYFTSMFYDGEISQRSSCYVEKKKPMMKNPEPKFSKRISENLVYLNYDMKDFMQNYHIVENGKENEEVYSPNGIVSKNAIDLTNVYQNNPYEINELLGCTNPQYKYYYVNNESCKMYIDYANSKTKPVSYKKVTVPTNNDVYSKEIHIHNIGEIQEHGNPERHIIGGRPLNTNNQITSEIYSRRFSEGIYSDMLNCQEETSHITYHIKKEEPVMKGKNSNEMFSANRYQPNESHYNNQDHVKNNLYVMKAHVQKEEPELRESQNYYKNYGNVIQPNEITPTESDHMININNCFLPQSGINESIPKIVHYEPNEIVKNVIYQNQTQPGDVQVHDCKNSPAVTNYETYIDQNVEEEPYQIRKKTTYNNQFPMEEDLISMKFHLPNPFTTNLYSIDEKLLPQNPLANVENQWPHYNQGCKDTPLPCKELEQEKSFSLMDIRNNSKLVQFHTKQNSNQAGIIQNIETDINQKECAIMYSSHNITKGQIEKEESTTKEPIDDKIINHRENSKESNDDLPVLSLKKNDRNKVKENSHGQINVSKYPNILKLFKNVDLSYKRKSFMEKDRNLIEQLTCQNSVNQEINKEEEEESEWKASSVKEESTEEETQKCNQDKYENKKEGSDAVGYEEFIFGDHKNQIHSKYKEENQEQEIRCTYHPSTTTPVPNQMVSTEVSQLIKQFMEERIHSGETEISFHKGMEEQWKEALRKYSLEHCTDSSHINQIEAILDSQASLELCKLYYSVNQESIQENNCENAEIKKDNSNSINNVLNYVKEEDKSKEKASIIWNDVNSLGNEIINRKSIILDMQKNGNKDKEEIEKEKKNSYKIETQPLDGSKNYLERNPSTLDVNVNYDFLLKTEGKEGEHKQMEPLGYGQGDTGTLQELKKQEVCAVDYVNENQEREINYIQKINSNLKQNQIQSETTEVCINDRKANKELQNITIGDFIKEEKIKNTLENAPYGIRTGIINTDVKITMNNNEIHKNETPNNETKISTVHIVKDEMMISTYLCNEGINYFTESNQINANREENNKVNYKDHFANPNSINKVEYNVRKSEISQSTKDANIPNLISNEKKLNEEKQNTEKGNNNPSNGIIYENFTRNKNKDNNRECTKRHSNELMNISYSNFSNNTPKDTFSEDMVQTFRKNVKRYSLGEFTNAYRHHPSFDSFTNNSASIECVEKELRKAISSTDIKNICNEIYKMENEHGNVNSTYEFYTKNTEVKKPVEHFTTNVQLMQDRRKTHSMFNEQVILVRTQTKETEIEKKKDCHSTGNKQEKFNEEGKRGISEIEENKNQRKKNHTLLKGKSYVDNLAQTIKEPSNDFTENTCNKKNTNLTTINEHYHEKEIQSGNLKIEYRKENTHLKMNESIHVGNQRMEENRKETLESKSFIMKGNIQKDNTDQTNGMKKNYKVNPRNDQINHNEKQYIEENSSSSGNSFIENTVMYITKQIENNYAYLQNQNHKISKTNKNVIPKNVKQEKKYTRNIGNTLPENCSSFSPEKVFSSSCMNLSKSFIGNLQYGKFFNDNEPTESMNCDHNLLKKSFHYLPHIVNPLISQNHMNQSNDSLRNLMNSNYYICNNWNASHTNTKRKEEMKNCMRLNKSSFHCVSNPYVFNKQKSTIASNKNNADINLLQTKIKYGSVFTRNGPTHPRVQTKGKT